MVGDPAPQHATLSPLHWVVGPEGSEIGNCGSDLYHNDAIRFQQSYVRNWVPRAGSWSQGSHVKPRMGLCNEAEESSWLLPSRRCHCRESYSWLYISEHRVCLRNVLVHFAESERVGKIRRSYRGTFPLSSALRTSGFRVLLPRAACCYRFQGYAQGIIEPIVWASSHETCTEVPRRSASDGAHMGLDFATAAVEIRYFSGHWLKPLTNGRKKCW